MTTTTAHTTIEQISDTIDALEAETTVGFLMLDVEKVITYRKRDFGGYFVEYNGLQLGWVVKEYPTSKWVAYIYGTAARGKGTNVDFDCPKRADAAKSVVEALLFENRRIDFEAYWEKRIADEARIAAILAS